jgi:3-hydroxyisobutyrate dehydrogenase-like beta-hydroxyacid dehydrogenase
MPVSIGILHPGQMGVAVAETLKNSGHLIWWASEGRRQATRDRAAFAGLQDAGNLRELAARCEVIFSVCPPEFAERQAEETAATGWRGLFIDANAISPEHVRLIARRMEEARVDFVDGGIIGPPPKERGQCWMHLSGPRAPEAAALFTAGPMEANVVPGAPGQASALKMCFAGYNKGSIALLCAVMAAAQRHGVLEELKQQWSSYGPKLPQVERQISVAAPKAWRWVHEMVEIAATLEAAGLPPGFHQAAAQLYGSLAGFKDRSEVAASAVIEKLTEGPEPK